MNGRSLLGGAKRQQEVREQRESERAWHQEEQKAESAAEPAEDADSAASPADAEATDTQDTQVPRGPSAEPQFDLHWNPDQPETQNSGQNAETPLRRSSLVPKESKPIDWNLGNSEPGDQAQRSESRSESWGQVSMVGQPQTDGSEISAELLSATARDMRERQLAKLGWWLLAGTLALAGIIVLL